jgi:hypothetical protein
VLERQALEIRQQCTKHDSPPVLLSMANLASTLCACGKYDDAETLLKHVIAASERTLEPDASLTLRSKSDLVAVMFHQGRLEEAAVLYNYLLETSIRKGDEPHIIRYW